MTRKIIILISLINMLIFADDAIEGVSLGGSKNLDSLSIGYYKKDASDSIRVGWIEKGGWIQSTSFGGHYLHMGSNGPMSSLHGVGFRNGNLNHYLKPPGDKGIGSSWFTFSVGSDGKLDVLFGEDIFIYDVILGIPVGGTIGIGSQTPLGWKGAMLNLHWIPNFKYEFTQMSFDFGGDTNTTTSHVGTLNLGGFGAGLEFGGFDKKMKEKAKEAHFSIYGFLIPGIGENIPTIWSVGFSLVKYKQKA